MAYKLTTFQNEKFHLSPVIIILATKHTFTNVKRPVPLRIRKSSEIKKAPFNFSDPSANGNDRRVPMLHEREHLSVGACVGKTCMFENLNRWCLSGQGEKLEKRWGV